MSNMMVMRVSVEGIRPLLWNAFSVDLLSGTKRAKTGSAGNDPEEWRRTVLLTPDRMLYLLPSYAFGCIRDAARYTKEGKGSVQRTVAATLQILDDIVLVDRSVPKELLENPQDFYNKREESVYIDVSGVKNPATKGKNVRYRIACSKGWKCSFSLLYDITLVSRNTMLSVLNDAGSLVGLGDGRSIGFGRFRILEIKESVYQSDAEKTTA